MAQADHLLEQAYDDSVLLANSERRSRRLALSHSGPLTNGLGLSSRHHALKSQSCRFSARQADIVRALEAREQNRTFGRHADLVKALEARQRNRLSSQSGSATSSGATHGEKSNGAGSVPIVTVSQPQQQQEQEEAQAQVQERTAPAQVQAQDKPVAAQAQAPAPAVAEPPKEPRKSNLKSSSIKQPAAAAAASDAAPRGRVLILTAPELDVDHHPTGSRHHVDGDHHARVSPAQPLDARVSPAQPLDAKDEKEGGEAVSASPGPGAELSRLSETAVDHCLASPLDLEHSELLGADLQARFQLLKADHHSASPSSSHTGPPPASPTLTHQVQALRSGSTGPLVIRLTSSGSPSASQLSARITSLQQSSGKAPPAAPAPAPAPPPPSAPAAAATATTPSPLPQAPAISLSSPPSDDASSANTCCSCLPSCLKQKDRKPSTADPLPKSSHPSPSHPSPPSPFHKQLQTPIATSNKHVTVPAKEEEPRRHEVDSAAASPQTQDFLHSVMDEVQQQEGEDEEQEQDWQDDVAAMKDSIHGPNILKTFSLKDVNKELSKATLDEATLAKEAQNLVQQALDVDLADGEEMGIDSAGELHNVKRRHMRSKSIHVKGMGNGSNASGNGSNANGNGHAIGSGFSESEDQDSLGEDQEDDSDGAKQRRKKAKRRAKR